MPACGKFHAFVVDRGGIVQHISGRNRTVGIGLAAESAGDQNIDQGLGSFLIIHIELPAEPSGQGAVIKTQVGLFGHFPFEVQVFDLGDDGACRSPGRRSTAIEKVGDIGQGGRDRGIGRNI